MVGFRATGLDGLRRIDDGATMLAAGDSAPAQVSLNPAGLPGR